MQYLGHIYTKKVFVIYLKFRFNWVSSILSDNSRECVGGSVRRLQLVPLTNRWTLIDQMWLCFGARSSEEHQLVRTPRAQLESTPGLPILSPGRMFAISSSSTSSGSSIQLHWQERGRQEAAVLRRLKVWKEAAQPHGELTLLPPHPRLALSRDLNTSTTSASGS